jgi:hypothetical protein
MKSRSCNSAIVHVEFEARPSDLVQESIGGGRAITAPASRPTWPGRAFGIETTRPRCKTLHSKGIRSLFGPASEGNAAVGEKLKKRDRGGVYFPANL